MRYPDFYIVGAAKSGTTALWEYLGAFSEIFMTKDIENKELGYFSADYGIKTKEEYLNYFQNAKSGQIIGESCHAYLTSPESAEWIKREVPEAKIIIVLRNPAKRAFSLYNWMVMNGYELTKKFEDALDIENKRKVDAEFKNNLPQEYFPNYEYFSSGLYYEQVKRFINVFGYEKCKVLIFEEFVQDPCKSLNEILLFLGIEEKEIPPLKKVNESHYVFNTKIQFYLRNKFPYEIIVSKLFPKKRYKIRELLMNMNVNKIRKAKIKSETHSLLMKKYNNDIKKLSDLLNKDLSNLWK